MKNNLKDTVVKAAHQVSKHSPLILTTLGVVGLGATAVFVYKATPRLEEITSNIEECRENEEDINRVEVTKDVVAALARPILVGTLSVCAVALSYYIQNNRIKGLAAALSTASAESLYYRNKFQKEFGKDKANDFYTPTEKTNKSAVNPEGEKVKVSKKEETDDLYGEWFDKSRNYTSDDHTYNLAFIASIEDKMQNKLFRNGYLVLNDLRDELGFDRNRASALVGWNSADNFYLDAKTVMVENPETGEREPQIYIHWPSPKYIYDDIEYSGRYSE